MEVEGPQIVAQNWEKTLKTMEILMNQLNMMYFFEKLKVKIKEMENAGHQPNVTHLEKLMGRCLKLYQMIDSIFKIFQLIRQKEVSKSINKIVFVRKLNIKTLEYLYLTKG